VRFEDVSEDGHILPSALFHAREIEQEAKALEQREEDELPPQKRAA
jgi:hypothetical protein